MDSLVFIAQGVFSFLFFIGVVGFLVYLSNVLWFGKNHKRTKEEMWGMPFAMGVFILFSLVLAALFNWLIV